MRLDVKRQVDNKDKKIESVLKQASHLEAATKIEEEEQTPKAADIRRDETKDLVEAVIKLVNRLSVDDKQRELIKGTKQFLSMMGRRETW